MSLPVDVEEVWGLGWRDLSGQLAAVTAEILIAAWGVERFRSSMLHRAAVDELARAERKRTMWEDPKVRRKP